MARGSRPRPPACTPRQARGRAAPPRSRLRSPRSIRASMRRRRGRSSHSQLRACRCERHRRSRVVLRGPLRRRRDRLERDAAATTVRSWRTGKTCAGSCSRCRKPARPSRTATSSGASATRGSSGSGRFAPPTSGRSATPRRAGPILGARVEHLVAKEALLADDPGVFFTTPHFDGFAAVLVRLEEITPQDLEEVVVEAWLAMAPPRLAKGYLEANPPGG